MKLAATYASINASAIARAWHTHGAIGGASAQLNISERMFDELARLYGVDLWLSRAVLASAARMGYSQREICEHLAVPRGIIRQRMKDWGIRTTAKRGRPPRRGKG